MSEGPSTLLQQQLLFLSAVYFPPAPPVACGLLEKSSFSIGMKWEVGKIGKELHGGSRCS